MWQGRKNLVLCRLPIAHTRLKEKPRPMKRPPAKIAAEPITPTEYKPIQQAYECGGALSGRGSTVLGRD